MSGGVSHNINGANHVKWIESQYRWNLVQSSHIYRLFSHVQSRRIYWDSLHMIDGAKPEIEGVNQDIDGAKCQEVEYFVVQLSQIQSNEIDGANYEMNGVKLEIDGVNHKIDVGNHVK